MVTVANSRVVTAPVIFEYGLTKRLTLGVVVPLVETRSTVGWQLNPTIGLANVGPNPALTPAGSGALAQNAALVSSLREASDTLRARVTTCQAAPTDPICAPISGQQSAVLALMQNTATLAGALERLYGTGTEHPGLPYVPINKNIQQEAINGQIAALQTAYQTFLSKSIVSGSVVPAAAPAANAQFQSLLRSVGHDTLRSVDRSSIGDISLGATFQVANTFRDTSDVVAGFKYRLAVNGTFRLGTGQPGNRNRFFDFGTGYGQNGLEGGAAADVQLNRRLSASAIGSYTLQLGTIDVERVPNAAGLAYPLGRPFRGTFSAGNVLALSILPRFRLAGYFSLNGRFSVLRTGADQYTLGASSDTASVQVAPSTPYGADCGNSTTDWIRILVFHRARAGREPRKNSVRGIVQSSGNDHRERRARGEGVPRAGRVARLLSAIRVTRARSPASHPEARSAERIAVHPRLFEPRGG
jgi:hypothetical protein